MCLFVDALKSVTEALFQSQFIDRVFLSVTLHFILFFLSFVCVTGSMHATA